MTNTIASAKPQYNDDVVKLFTLATIFWGIAGFLVGVLIAAQLAFPQLNFEPFLSFGRLRPLHTSAVIFAFGGSALFATSYYVVQRTCGVRLWNDRLALFTFWGYQFFIVIAGLGYLAGEPPPIKESISGVNPDKLWATLRRHINGTEALYGGADYRIFAAG